MGDARLGLPLDKIKDRHARRLAPRAGGRRNGDQRLQRPGDRLAAADRRVDIVEEVGRISRIKIGRLRRVDRAAAADGDERIEVAQPRDVDGRVKAAIRRLRLDGVKRLEIDPGRLERFANDVARRQIE
jgi:hypothetical protein